MASPVSLSAEQLWLLRGKFSAQEPVRDIPVHQLPFQIGRRSDLPLVLPFPTVSNCHAEIIDWGGTLAIRDLGSTNGTYVNGQPVTSLRPIHEGDRIQIANIVFQLQCEAGPSHCGTVLGSETDGALALLQFDRLMTEQAIVPFFQPIVGLSQQEPAGCEVLSRSQLYGLHEPDTMFQAASQLGLETELSRLCREVGLRIGHRLPDRPPLFVNTHPRELEDLPGLQGSIRELRKTYPDQRIVLEVHEKSVTDVHTMRSLRGFLCDLDIRVAYDDFGAGQARLVELVEEPPDFLKFDISLIRHLDRTGARRQSVVATLVHMARNLGVSPIAEGVETASEAATCRELGFEYGQGFYYGRPEPASKLG